MGATSPLYPLGRTGAELRQRPRGRISLPPPPPKSRNVPGESNSPIPRFVRILKGSVVNICFSYHHGFVFGEHLSRMREKGLPLEGKVDLRVPGDPKRRMRWMRELYGESKEIVRPLLPCCGARKTLPLDGARLRFSTAATRPSPLHPPPAARRRAPPSSGSFGPTFPSRGKAISRRLNSKRTPRTSRDDEENAP